jgi:hypothetical protein
MLAGKVSGAVAVSPAMLAPILTTVCIEAGPVEMGNVADTAPSGTVTAAGTETSVGAELERFTDAPPAAAGEASTTRLATVVAATPEGTVLGASSSRKTPVD